MKRIISALIILVLTLSLAACKTQPKPADPTAAPEETAEPAAPTEAPTEELTEAPTEEPTEEPTPDPLAEYDVHDYTVLRDFFEQKDENGVTNGSKLFPNYDPADPETWYDGSHNYDNAVIWTEDGRVSDIHFTGPDAPVTYEESCSGDPLVLTGALELAGFDGLHKVLTSYVLFDSVDASGIGTASNMGLNCVKASLVKGEAYFSGGYVERICLLSAKHVLVDMTGDEVVSTWLPDTFGLKVDVTTEGEGYAGVSAWDDENYYEVRLRAHPMAGHKFVGWFDAEGNLVSTENVYELFGEKTEKNVWVSKWDLAFTARFE